MNLAQLNNGRKMPMIGLGTFRVHGRNLILSVIDAGLQAGYRAIDTASVYQNEEDIGLALKSLLPKYNLTREDIFLTTKLAPNDHGGQKVIQAVERSLKNLQTSYIDLYLIHWPGVSGYSVESSENSKLRDNTWSQLVDLYKLGKLRAIGVSNYTCKHINELLAHNHGVDPSVNQVECHPHFKQAELLKLCQAKGILLQAYSSMGGTSEHRLLDDPAVLSVAKSCRHTPAQVLLRWALQQGIAIIPKSVTPKRIAENIDLNFTLTASELHVINNISTKHKYAWNPSEVA